MRPETLRPEHVMAARTLIGWSRDRLAARMGISCSVVSNFEQEGAVRRLFKPAKAIEVLEGAGVEFIAENGGGAAVRLREPMAMSITPDQMRSGRKLLRWSQLRFALEADVALTTISSFEAAKRMPSDRLLDKLRITLEAAGVEFSVETGGRAVVRLKQRERADAPD